MAFNSPHLGSLMDPLGKIMQPNGTAVPPQGRTAPAETLHGMSTGQLAQTMQPTQQPMEPPVQPNTPEYEQRVARNKSFLQSPEIKAGLLQMGFNLMAGGDLASSLGGGLEAAGRVSAGNYEAEQDAIKNAREERRVQIEEGNFGINVEEFKMKRRKEIDDQKLQLRRDALFHRAGSEDINAMSDEDLLNLAGELTATNDLDGAKIVIDMANSRRLGTSTQDSIEYKQSLEDGSWTPDMGGLYDFMQARANAKAAKTTVNTGSPKLMELAVKDIEMADTATQKVMDLQNMLQVAQSTPTGWTVPYTLPVRAALKSIGITIDESNQTLPLQQIMQSQTARLALNMRSPEGAFSEGGLPGSASDKDLQFLKESVSNLANTPEANEILLIGMIAKARRVAEISASRGNWILGDNPMKEWTKEAKKIYEVPLLTEEERTHIANLLNPERVMPGSPNIGGSGAKVDPSIPDVPPSNISEYHQGLWIDAVPELRRYWMETDK